MRITVFALALLSLSSMARCSGEELPAGQSGKDAIFDVRAILSTPLRPRVIKTSRRSGIVTEEVRFHSERDANQDVEIFAFFSYPEEARGLPAYIWNPGGLGQASQGYTEGGARRGYATLCIDFPQPGYRSTGSYPINTGLILPADPRRAPIYHGAVALLKAVSFLETRPEVDKNRIGMAGSSWGGFFTTLMIGIDSRLKVGAALYGTGNLQLGNAWWDGQSKNGKTPPSPAERERWRTTLDPAGRLPKKKTPIGWFTGTNDRFYLMPDVMRTYEMAAGPKQLTLVPNWDHALPGHLHDDLFLAWLDLHLKGKRTLPSVTPIEVRNESGRLVARWTFDGKITGEISGAELIASYGERNWAGRFWHVLPAQIEGNRCRAELPAAGLPCYVSGSVITEQGLRSSTPLSRIDSKELGVISPTLLPDYDGCQEWGGFEPSQMSYLRQHNRSGQTRWQPRLSSDAVEGKNSAILEAGQTVLPPILSTSNVPHRFTCWLKGDKPVQVTLRLDGHRKTFDVGPKWSEFRMDYTPPEDVMGLIPASLTAPAGAAVLVDAIAFHPIP